MISQDYFALVWLDIYIMYCVMLIICRRNNTQIKVVVKKIFNF